MSLVSQAVEGVWLNFPSTKTECLRVVKMLDLAIGQHSSSKMKTPDGKVQCVVCSPGPQSTTFSPICDY